jgi:hypothetical protein
VIKLALLLFAQMSAVGSHISAFLGGDLAIIAPQLTGLLLTLADIFQGRNSPEIHIVVTLP